MEVAIILKLTRKPVASYIKGVFEKEHPSLSSAVEYLQQNGCPRADKSGIQFALKWTAVRYGRTWKAL